MKQNKEDIVILLAVVGIIIFIIGFAYLIREFRTSPRSGSNNYNSAPGTYNELTEGQVNESQGEESQKMREKNITPAKVRLVIDAIMAAGLLGGLSLILRGRVNYMLIIGAVGIIIVIIDLYLRNLFG
ncbi:hypothetical protein [Phosphitispora fastidiosa]|uniref:hypothetical protein n=1 Tax=Phosphitispora fastidiosa TaxID=2837202 RepID=UPI001E422142|nr:hypothetical protein [Phosphitispora fastidiosa]MBU7005703.1 hypothetical protein [Phosphitispora fastidiosa]